MLAWHLSIETQERDAEGCYRGKSQRMLRVSLETFYKTDVCGRLKQTSLILITGRSPMDIQVFNETMIKLCLS